MQTFFKCILDALGYKTDFFPVTVLGYAEHVGIIAYDLSFKDSKHNVDIGCVYPTFEAIPLNFEEESPIYSFSFLKYKYKKRADDIMEWLHQSRSDKTQWFRFAEMAVSNPVPVSYFFKTTEHDFSDPRNQFNATIRISHYNGNCFFSVKGKVIKWSEEKEQKLLQREVETKEEVTAILIKEFPQFPVEIIEQALLNTM